MRLSSPLCHSRLMSSVFSSSQVDVLLALGKDEAVRHELAGGKIELADRDRVLAAVGQADEAAALGGRRAIHALEDPIRLLRLGQSVKVEDGVHFGWPDS